MSVFGAVVVPDAVEADTIALLKEWFPTYLAEVERLTSRAIGSLQPPRSYIVSNRFERRPADQLPSCIVISPGLAEPPVQRGDGNLDAVFRLEVGVMVGADTRENTNQLAKAYGAAVLLMLLQKRPAVASGRATTIGLTYDEVPASMLDIGAAAVVVANVPVAAIANVDGGPLVPDLNPADWQLVDTVNIDIQRRSLA